MPPDSASRQVHSWDRTGKVAEQAAHRLVKESSSRRSKAHLPMADSLCQRPGKGLLPDGEQRRQGLDRAGSAEQLRGRSPAALGFSWAVRGTAVQQQAEPVPALLWSLCCLHSPAAVKLGCCLLCLCCCAGISSCAEPHLRTVGLPLRPPTCSLDTRVAMPPNESTLT